MMNLCQMKAGYLALAIAVCPSMAALAQGSLNDRVQELERRVQGIESNTQEILRLMRQGGGASTHGAVATEPRSSATLREPAGLSAGLKMGICLLEQDAQRGKLPRNCPGLLSAVSHVDVPDSFGWQQAFKQQQISAIVPQSSRPVALMWNGVLRINESGRHVFQITLRNTQVVSDVGCLSAFFLNDKEILNVDNLGIHMMRGPFTNQGGIDLGVGLYNLRIALVCRDYVRQDLANIEASITMAEPGESHLKQIPSDRIASRN